MSNPSNITQTPTMSYPETLNQLIDQRILAHSDRIALASKKNKKWESITYSEFGNKIHLFSNGLISLGILKGDRVAILSENRPEWLIADLANQALGAVTVPIYASLPPGQIAHILNDSEAKAIIVEGKKQAAKITAVRDQLKSLEQIICMDPIEGDPTIISFDYLVGVGEGLSEELAPGYQAMRDSVKPEDLASLVYTSGTTGEPKGAMLTHRNFCSAVQQACSVLPFKGEEEIFLSFLPLCHIFERVTSYISLNLGAATYYSEGVFKLQENMTDINPTVMQSVPRVYEAISSRALDNVSQLPEKRKKIALWALETGNKYAIQRKRGGFISPILSLQHKFAEKKVLSVIREKLGTRWSFMVSGGAPLNSVTAQFFESIGIPMIEGYGLTETAAAVCLNPASRTKLGTVGKPMPLDKVKIADDGELLFSGPNIMKGYWKGDDATAQMIDSDGWLHTGDIGKIDSDGYVQITDRKKDIIVLANGKNVAPQPIETTLKNAPLVSEIVLLGDKSGTVSALVIPNFDLLKRWAKENGMADASLEELVSSPEARKAVKEQIDQHSGDLADFEKVRRIALLHRALSIEDGELTPTHKVRRRAVQERFGHLLD